MEPLGSLPCSQEFSNNPNPEPDESNNKYTQIKMTSASKRDLLCLAWKVFGIRSS
jgi:hypothetical protein